MKNGRIYYGDCLRILSSMPDACINMCLCSPPYYQLRDYGGEGQLGWEATPQEYVEKLCTVFDEVKRVLKPTGTCFVNLGDTYRDGSLCQIPARFSIEMANRGWIFPNEIIWHKRNCMPSSGKRRFTVDFEKMFFFAKTKNYYFQRQYEPLATSSVARAKYSLHCDRTNNGTGVHVESMGHRFCNPNGRNKRCVWSLSTSRFKGRHFATYPEELCEPPIKAGCPEFVCRKCANPRQRIYDKVDGIAQSVRVASKRRKKCGDRLDEVNTAPSDGMIERYRTSGWTDCGCNAGFTRGIVLDPFAGTGTSLAVARRLGRFFVGCEINPDYCRMIEERLKGNAVPPATCDQVEEKCPSIGVSE